MKPKIEWLNKGENGQNPEIRFTSPIGVDDGYRNNPQGEKKSTMTFYKHSEDEAGIEWIVNDGEFVEGIGLWFNEAKELVDYDGVFELPMQAIMMIRGLGYHVSKEYEPE